MGKTQSLPDYPRGITFEQVWAALMEDRELLRKNAELQAEQQAERHKEIDRIVKDVAERQKETDRRQKETDRLIKENAARQKETDRQMKETDRQIKENAERQKETDRLMKETDRLMKETDRLIKENAERQKETARQMKETDRQIKEYNKRFGDFTNRFGEVVEYMIAPNLLKKIGDTGLCFTQASPNRFFTDSEHNISFEVDVLLENHDKAMLVEVKTRLTIKRVREHIKRLEKMRTYADFHGDKRVFFGALAGVVMTPEVKKYALEQGFFVVEPSGETFNITPPEGAPKEW